AGQPLFDRVLAALRNGKRLTEATLYLERGEETWKLTLKGELFQFASLKAPPVQLEKDDTVDAATEREAVFYERQHLLGTAFQLFDSLFASFLGERLGTDWPATEQVIATWLAATAASDN
ncbi:MAG TPA: exonuclease, partial [Geobacteraceae bacterium]